MKSPTRQITQSLSLFDDKRSTVPRISDANRLPIMHWNRFLLIELPAIVVNLWAFQLSVCLSVSMFVVHMHSTTFLPSY